MGLGERWCELWALLWNLPPKQKTSSDAIPLVGTLWRACGFLIVVGLRFMPYESHNVSKCNLNSDPLSYINYWHLGYLHNQILLTNRLI